MKCSIEISMYPLSEDYERIVLGFLDNLKNENLDFRTSGINTQIFGDYQEVWPALGRAMQRSYEEHEKASFVIKVLSGEHKALMNGY